MVNPPLPSRVMAIEQRIASMRSTGGAEPATSKHLGFASVLAEQTATRGMQSPSAMSLGSLMPSVERTPGSYGPVSPPAELVPFGNGTIPTSALSPVGQTGHRLWAPAANALTVLISDAAANGVAIGITDSYRPIETQERLADEKGLYSQGGLAAVPGTSNHGWGLATDLDLDDRGLEWMRSNGWRYGFVEDVPREPWHWTYRAGS